MQTDHAYVRAAVSASMAELPAVDLLRAMALAREGDRREGILLRQGKGWFQISGAGHEALAAVAYALRPEDTLYLSYRDRAIALARGLTNYEIALGYFGKQDSGSAGRQMPSHYSSRALNLMSCATPTGLQCLPAAGTAWACRMAGKGQVAMFTIGDASARQGDFYEAVCFALQDRLPLIVLVEDNGYGISTPTAGMNPFSIGAMSGPYVMRVDGRNAYAVYAAACTAAERARSGDGPTVIWAEVDRIASHTSSDDHRVYRDAEDIAEMEKRDPLILLLEDLVTGGAIQTDEWESEVRAMADAIDEDYRRAEAAPEPDTSRVASLVFSEKPVPVITHRLPQQDTWTMAAAVNVALGAALAEDDRVLMFGEDIADPKGGVFGLTKGLSTRFPDRVINSPLAEATIAGTAVGLAAAGVKPVFELQFIDFVGPAFNQIVNQLATLRWRSNGEWTCPAVVIAPCGAYLPSGGPWHSQTNESWFAHAPGIRVVMPSTPYDAAAALRAAVAGDDPVLLLLPKHLFRPRYPMEEERPFSLGRAYVRQQGTDVTVVAWGNCIEVVQAAAESAAKGNISAEIIDMVSLAPVDLDTIRESLARTGRLVVVQEDARSCSVGQAIVSEMNTRPDCWDLFAAPPQLISRPDVHIGFHSSLEAAVLPAPEQVLQSIRLVMTY